MFTNLKKRLIEDADKRKNDTIFYIKNGYMSNWSTEYHNNLNRGLKQYSTDTRWHQFKKGIITREKAVEYATNRVIKQFDKELNNKLNQLERIAAAPDLEYISISIEWKHNKTWGNNPHVIVRSNIGIYTGTASGCGYDKESTAIAQAFNQCDSILKEIYILKEKGLKAGLNDYSSTACTGVNNSNICGYGAGYDVLPYFEGGVGVNSFWSILEKCDFEIHSYHTKKHDYYSIERSE